VSKTHKFSKNQKHGILSQIQLIQGGQAKMGK